MNIINIPTKKCYYFSFSALQYLRDHNIPGEGEFLMVVGHSLGGGIAQIVASHLHEEGKYNVMSFGLSSPGTAYSSKKFGFQPSTLTFNSITVYGKRDPIFYGDLHGGAIESIECHRKVSLDCHRTQQSFCELANSCFHYQQDECLPHIPESKCNFARDLCAD